MNQQLFHVRAAKSYLREHAIRRIDDALEKGVVHYEGLPELDLFARLHKAEEAITLQEVQTIAAAPMKFEDAEAVDTSVPFAEIRNIIDSVDFGTAIGADKEEAWKGMTGDERKAEAMRVLSEALSGENISTEHLTIDEHVATHILELEHEDEVVEESLSRWQRFKKWLFEAPTQ